MADFGDKESGVRSKLRTYQEAGDHQKCAIVNRHEAFEHQYKRNLVFALLMQVRNNPLNSKYVLSLCH